MRFTKIILILAILAAYPILLHGYWSLAAMASSPQSINKIKQDFRMKSSEELLEQLSGYGNPYHIAYFSPYPVIALQVLEERKEKQVVPVVLEFLKLKNEYRRKTAIRVLGGFGDKRAIKPLMKILEKGEKQVDYGAALEALSEMKFEGAYPYLVKYASREDAARNGSIGMLEKFGKPECILILTDIKGKIKDSDPWAGFSRGKIDRAIEQIKSVQK